MNAALPQIGDFIRPIGHYAYCLQAVKITEYKTGKQTTYKRWGLMDGQPFDDGHCSSGFFLNDLVAAGNEAWKQPAFNDDQATYYRKILVRKSAIGQMQLFN